jgi:hypothetical protein
VHFLCHFQGTILHGVTHGFYMGLSCRLDEHSYEEVMEKLLAKQCDANIEDLDGRTYQQVKKMYVDGIEVDTKV